MTKQCLNCKCSFNPYKHILNQQYCSKKACQNARKANWVRQRLKRDKDYKNYRREIQKKWRSKNHSYWAQRKKSSIERTELNNERNYKVKIIVKKDIINLSKTGEIKRICQLVLTPIDKT